MDIQSSSRHLVEIDLTQESGDDTDFTAEEEDTEEEDDIKIEDLSEMVASPSTKPVADNPANEGVSTAPEEVDDDDEQEEEEDDSSGGSDSIDDLIDDGTESSKQTSPDPEEPSNSRKNVGGPDRLHQDESGKGARFIKYNQGIEPEEGSSRSYVSDSWSELGDEEERQESTEAQEAVIDEHFKEALAALRANKRDKAMRIFLNILTNPLVIKEFQVERWTDFDWTSAKAKTSSQRASNLAKIFFSTNVAMAKLVENPVPFYMQALSVRPELSKLWYECGKTAAKLSDWSTAEFCFKQCNKDDFRAWESLLLLHFLQDNYHECLIYLQKILAQCKDHRLAHYIRCRIAQSAPLWKEFCEKKFAGGSFEKTLDPKLEKQIADKIADFTSKGANEARNASLNPFAEILRPIEVYAPLRLKLDLNMKAEQLGSLLCDAFDRIEAFSLFSKQPVIVEEEEDDLNLLMSTDDEIGVTAEITEQAHATYQPGQRFQQDVADSSKNLLKCVKEVIDDMLDTIIEGTEYFTTNASNENHPPPSFQKNKSSKKQPTTNGKNTRRLGRQFTQHHTNTANNPNIPLSADDSVRCRRSTRFVEDLDASQFSSVEAEGISSKSDLLRLMSIPRTVEAPCSPLSKRFSMGTARNSLNSSIDCLNGEVLPLPSVKELAKKWVETSEMSVQYCLFDFLKWIAVDLQEQGFHSVTVDEADVFRQVYIRWSDTFSDALNNVSTPNVVWEDMCIHLLAAELGSPRALSILQTHFATKETVGARTSQGDVELRKSVSSSSIQTPKNSRNVAERVDVSTLSAISQHSGFAESDMRMMADLLNRMLEEENFSAINATIQRLQRHSISEKTSLLDEAMDQSSVKSNSPHPFSTYNPCLQRMVEIRYHWLVAQLKPEEIGLPGEGPTSFLHRYINMLELVALMRDGERVQSHASFGSGCISLLNVSGLLYEQWTHFNAQQIDHLKETKQYEELQYALLHHFDWSEASEEVQIDQLFLLVECALKTDDMSLAVEYLLTIMKRLHQKVLPQKESKKALKRGLNFFIKDINLAELSDLLVCGLGKVLAEMASSEQFYSCTTLWIICHRISKYREGDLSESTLVHFYEETAAMQKEEDNCLPTKSLMVLMKAHEALGEAQKCDQEQGRFLRFFLDELAETMAFPVVQQALASDKKYSVIVENVQTEVFQCINCAFGECKSLRKYDDHGSQCKWQADWPLALTILPLLLPEPLPLVYSLDKLSSDLVDVIFRVFKFVLEVQSELENNLLEFCKNPPEMELREITDPDGIALHFAEEYHVDGDPRDLLPSQQYLVGVSPERQEQLSLSAKCLYLSSLAQHRNNINNPNQDMMKVIRCCLAISNPYLDNQLQSSVWYMYARNLANEYIMLPSHELVEQVDQFLFPFKMSIYLKPDFCEAHLDIATITYQVRTRIKRFSARSDVDEDKRKTARRKMDGMLLKCRVHFELARKHNDSPAEVPWLSSYFLAKIGEKLGEAPEKIGKLYHESALALEQEGYLYPQKIHRSKQINFEPLEIHYKLHSYALKKVNEWKSINKYSQSSLHSCLPTLHTLQAYLKLFSYHGVETKTASPQLFLKEPHLSNIQQQQKSPKDSLEDDVVATVNNIVEAVDLQSQIQSTCMSAFETIVGKFPHYKACYRMAKHAFNQTEHKACSDLLFHRLLLPSTGAAGAKKKGATAATPLTNSTSLFENVVEISRADIERSGSFAYHIHKILNLAIISSFKCHDLGRLVLLLSSLATLHNEEQAPDKVVREDIRSLQTKCCNAITRIAPVPKMNTEKLAHNCSLLQDLLRKLRKENSNCVVEMEKCLATCLEKRAAWTTRQQQLAAAATAAVPVEQAATMQHQQQLQAPTVAKRATSPVRPPPHSAKKREWEKIDVITLPETPPRPDAAVSTPSPTTSATTLQQQEVTTSQGGALRAVIKQHFLHKSTAHLQPPKKTAKRALDASQTSPTKTAAPPPAKKVTLEVDRDNLSIYFEEVLKRMPPEGSAQVVNYIQNPNIDKDEKKRYVLKVLASAGFSMAPSPQKMVNSNGASAIPPTAPAAAHPPHLQQLPTHTPQPRKRKVVLPRDPRLQTPQLNGSAAVTTLPTAGANTPQTSSNINSTSHTPNPIQKTVVANSPADTEVSCSSSNLAKVLTQPVASKPSGSSLQPRPPANTAPNKPKRPRIQAPPKDGQQQHKKSIATKNPVSSASLPSAFCQAQQMGGNGSVNMQDILRLASLLPPGFNEQALKEALREAGGSKEAVQASACKAPGAGTGEGNGALNLGKQTRFPHTAQNAQSNLVGDGGIAKPSPQRPLHQLPAASFTSPSSQHSQISRCHTFSYQQQTHTPPAKSSKPPTSTTSQQYHPSLKVHYQQLPEQLPSFHPSPFSSPTSSLNSNRSKLGQRAPQGLTLPLKQATTSSQPGRPLDLQTAVHKQKQKPQANQKTAANPSSSPLKPAAAASSSQQTQQLTQAQMQAHTQLQLEKLQQYLRQHQQQGQQSWMPLLVQQLSQQTAANLPLQSAGTSRKSANGSVEQGLAEIARRFELQKLAFEQRSLQEQGSRRN